MRYYQKSDIGKLRANNQDSCGIYINNNGYVLAMVSDGIGGLKAGEIASSMAIEYMSKPFLKKTFKQSDNLYHWLREAVENVNRQILKEGAKNEEHRGMGATLVGALITNERTYVFNVGDSRCYLIGDKHMNCVTHDHTLLQRMLESGLIAPEEAENNPNRHVLINALGIDQPLRVDIEAFNNLYDMLLLCSDGLYGYVPEEEIRKVLLRKGSVEHKTEKLVQLANNAGGFDNVTVIVVEGGDGE